MSSDILISLLAAVLLLTLYYFVELRRVVKIEKKYWNDEIDTEDRKRVSEPVLKKDE